MREITLRTFRSHFSLRLLQLAEGISWLNGHLPTTFSTSCLSLSSPPFQIAFPEIRANWGWSRFTVWSISESKAMHFLSSYGHVRVTTKLESGIVTDIRSITRWRTVPDTATDRSKSCVGKLKHSWILEAGPNWHELLPLNFAFCRPTYSVDSEV